MAGQPKTAVSTLRTHEAPGDPGNYRAPRVQLTVKDFKVGRLLGLGSFSKVIQARLKSTGEGFALKVMDKQHIIREKKVEQVKRERVILDQLDHPGVIRLCFTFQDEYSLFMGMELCLGGELFDLIRKRGQLDESDARFYAAEIVAILEYIHSLNIVHRDLKPENLLLTTEGHLKLADFGSAKLLDLYPDKGEAEEGTRGEEKRRKSFVGTAEYVSPEVLNGGVITSSVDLWALGCITFQMLAGRPPFKAASEYLCFQKVLRREFEVPPHFSPLAKDLVEHLLVLQPSERLGAGPTGMAELRQHPFFQGFDWGPPDGPVGRPDLWSRPASALATARLVAGNRGESDGEDEGEEEEELDWELTVLGASLAEVKLGSEAGGRERHGGAGEQGSDGGEKGARSPLLVQGEQDKWAPFLQQGERLLASSLVRKFRGLSSKRRQLLLTDQRRFLYLDPARMVLKGEIPWSTDLCVQVDSPCNFIVVTPKRTYFLQESRGLAWEWKAMVDQLQQQR